MPDLRLEQQYLRSLRSLHKEKANGTLIRARLTVWTSSSHAGAKTYSTHRHTQCQPRDIRMRYIHSGIVRRSFCLERRIATEEHADQCRRWDPHCVVNLSDTLTINSTTITDAKILNNYTYA